MFSHLRFLNHNSLLKKCDIRPIWDQVYLEAFPVVDFEFFRFSNFLGGPEELEGDRVVSQPQSHTRTISDTISYGRALETRTTPHPKK